MQIINLTPDEGSILSIAEMLVEAFRDNWPEAWPDLESALAEVRESFSEERISRIAVGDNGEVLGWIGGIRMYDGNAWELHPLVVKPVKQAHGIGRALVLDFEEQVRLKGGLTIYLGTDDENNMTTLSGVNLYQPNVWTHIAAIKNLRRHPYEFYQKMGFSIIGVLPDANGRGKPDIYMAKRI
ncbi:MAG: GNAT family N-acetyltransferase [Chloroflexi bacterium]|uniref:GNAT family N-acetyltransferase n=1 Tax=Candidatus Chlorohelix allophototropha TaxID=3003348 RepID=A0A8T7LWG8_9CHLR|nr:GNAT family N-acetyltransferase [Chloroflexota bacterium]WJW65675.1 GNAT family N-acetyltransferase [Chloroflexota bacterium L227-S17]